MRAHVDKKSLEWTHIRHIQSSAKRYENSMSAFFN
jgi:hypothetical protein